MKIAKYEVLPNFYIFISHTREGETNCSYGLVSEDNKKMIEVIPKYGPISILESDQIVGKYIAGEKLDRGNWTQCGFDDSHINDYLSVGRLEQVKNILQGYLD